MFRAVVLGILLASAFIGIVWYQTAEWCHTSPNKCPAWAR
jgi:predicted outer membrane lipoprotein